MIEINRFWIYFYIVKYFYDFRMYRNVEMGETDKVGSYEGQDKPEMQYLFMLHNFGDFGE